MKSVLNKGHVRLVDQYGDELRIVNFARASYGREKQTFEPSDAKLIEFLLKNRHGTPFEAVDFTFHVKAPITVAREWFRHRIASYNEISGRYVELEDDFYVPQPHRIRRQVGKPGAYTYERITDVDTKVKAVATMIEAYEACYSAYKTLLELGLAKDLARNVLALGLYTQFYFKVNARALMNFLSLRNAPSAMEEIQEYAEALEERMKESLPHTHAAFVKYGRVAP